jgi:hypothetical protein
VKENNRLLAVFRDKLNEPTVRKARSIMMKFLVALEGELDDVQRVRCTRGKITDSIHNALVSRACWCDYSAKCAQCLDEQLDIRQDLDRGDKDSEVLVVYDVHGTFIENKALRHRTEKHANALIGSYSVLFNILEVVDQLVR